jgi:hypothetical protein
MVCNRMVHEFPRCGLSVLTPLTLTLGYFASAPAAQGHTAALQSEPLVWVVDSTRQ